MQRMNPTNGHDLPYWWSAALGLFSLLSLQDYVFIIGALVSAFFTIKPITQNGKKSVSVWLRKGNEPSCWKTTYLM